jgi:P-type Cu+ transporter
MNTLLSTYQSDAKGMSRPQCFHCGTACPDGGIEQNGLIFCCTGCLTVYSMLNENGLCKYYDIQEHPGLRFKTEGIDRFEFLDVKEVADSFVRFRNHQQINQATCVFTLPTIYCASCLWLLEHLYKLNSGILHSEVDITTKNITITFDEGQTSIRNIAELLTRLGYEPDVSLAQLSAESQSFQQSINSQSKGLYYKLGIAGFAFANTMLFCAPDYLARISNDGALLEQSYVMLFGWLSLLLATPVLVYSAKDYFTQSYLSLRYGKALGKLSMDVPIALGISVLFFRSAYEVISQTGSGYFDSFTGLVFFLLIGKLLNLKTFTTLNFDRDYRSFFPLAVTKISNVSGIAEEHSVPVNQLIEGDIILVRNAEVIPADCTLISAVARIDYSMVSGESEPVELNQDAQCYAGGRVVGNAIECKVIRKTNQSYLTTLWNEAGSKISRRKELDRVTDVFAKGFTFIVISIALASCIWWYPDMHMIMNATTAILIVACPCAITLAAPFTFGSVLSILGKSGVYLKNGGITLDLASVDTIVFDKTGTLTELASSSIVFHGEELTVDEKLIVSSLLRNSTHPMAKVVSEWLLQDLSSDSAYNSSGNVLADIEEIPGKGMIGYSLMNQYRIGSRNWISGSNANTNRDKIFQENNKELFIESDNVIRGFFTLQSQLKEGIDATLNDLKDNYELHLLSGDNDSDKVIFDDVIPAENMRFACTPHEKKMYIEHLIKCGKRVMMIGDGINDSGALQVCSVGMAVTQKNASFTPQSDVIVHSDGLSFLPDVLAFARQTTVVLFTAFLVSVIYNIIGISLAWQGKLTPMIAALFMPLSSWSVVAIGFGLTTTLGSLRFRKYNIASIQSSTYSKDKYSTNLIVTPIPSDPIYGGVE